MNKVTFRNGEQAAIFEHELKGQISDGLWENTPYTDFEVWCNAKVEVGEHIGRNFPHVRKDNFGVAAKKLVDIVGDRMLGYARAARVFGLDRDMIELSSYGFKLPEYWSPEKKAKHTPDSLAKAQMKLTEQEKIYGMKQLMQDLREIKRTIRIVAK